MIRLIVHQDDAVTFVKISVDDSLYQNRIFCFLLALSSGQDPDIRRQTHGEGLLPKQPAFFTGLRHPFPQPAAPQSCQIPGIDGTTHLFCQLPLCLHLQKLGFDIFQRAFPCIIQQFQRPVICRTTFGAGQRRFLLADKTGNQRYNIRLKIQLLRRFLLLPGFQFRYRHLHRKVFLAFIGIYIRKPFFQLFPEPAVEHLLSVPGRKPFFAHLPADAALQLVHCQFLRRDDLQRKVSFFFLPDACPVRYFTALVQGRQFPASGQSRQNPAEVVPPLFHHPKGQKLFLLLPRPGTVLCPFFQPVDGSCQDQLLPGPRDRHVKDPQLFA